MPHPLPKTVLVYDFALRVFQWAFAGSLTASLVLAATAWIGGLFASYRSGATSVWLPLTGPVIELGEAKSDEKSRSRDQRKHRDD